MKGNRTGRRGAVRKAAVARNLLYFRNQVESGRRQNWRVQNLANVASSFGALIMRVEKREAGRDIQQQHAAQKRQCWPRESSPRIES
jgi:hypothetical protein